MKSTPGLRRSPECTPARSGTRARAARAGLILAVALGGVACAVNPATGRRQTMLISEEGEFRVGKQADEKIRKEYGVYLEKPELRNYVVSIGRQLAARGARPNLEYHFEVLDSTLVNAFALPGGFVYVTRGILEQMNSEDELAAVLGHEIAHVAARHGAAQISKAYLAQAGLIALAIFGDPNSAAALGDLANLAVGLALQGYSREYERQADDLGIQYATAAGFNPKGSVQLLATLGRLEKREPSSVESFFMSHPRTSERLHSAQQEVADLRAREPDAVSRPLRRDDYITQLDGMAVGLWNGRALLVGNRLYDKEHRLTMEIPKGFTAEMGSEQIVAIFRRSKGEIQAGLAVEPLPRKQNPKELFEQFRDKNKSMKPLSSGERTGEPLGLWEARFGARDREGKPVELSKAWAVHEGLGVTLSLMGPAGEAEEARKEFEAMVSTLAPLGAAEAAAVQPPRLKARQVAPGETWESIAAETLGQGEAAEKLAAFNGFEPEEPPPAGGLIKVPPSLVLE